MTPKTKRLAQLPFSPYSPEGLEEDAFSEIRLICATSGVERLHPYSKAEIADTNHEQHLTQVREQVDGQVLRGAARRDGQVAYHHPERRGG